MVFAAANPTFQMQLGAATPPAGFAKQNGTPTILTANVPNDGNNHKFLIFFTEDVTSAETGGSINVNWTAPDGTAGSASLVAGGKGVGVFPGGNYWGTICKAGTTVTVTQSAALTLGAAVLWCEIWIL